MTSMKKNDQINNEINNAKVTIVTVSYNIIEANREDVFNKCIESVQNQTYKNIEHIIIDGGSKDGSVELIKKYADKGLIKYISEPDNGIYDAMEKGSKLATGDYIYFLNTDDSLHDNNVIEDVVIAFEKYEADAIFGNLYPYVKDENDPYLKVMVPGQLVKFSHFESIYNLIEDNIHHQTIFYKTKIFKNCKFIDKKFPKGSDWYLHIQAFLKHKYKAKYIDRTITNFNLGGVSTGAQDNVMKEYFELKDKIQKEIKQYPKPFYYYIYRIKNGCQFYFKEIRRWFIQIRFRKGQKRFRLFGIDFIKQIKTDEAVLEVAKGKLIEKSKLNAKCKICNFNSRHVLSGEILNKYNIKYFYCDNCEHLQTEKPFWLKKAYKQPIGSLDTGIISRNYKNAILTSSIILEYFDLNAIFLEYAGGYGILSRMMRDIGFDFYWMDKYSKNIFAKGFEYNSEEKVELLTAFEVIEHFAEPMEEFEAMFKLSDNVLISQKLIPNPIPNIEEWAYYSPLSGQHISFYREKTLKFIAEKFNKNVYSFYDTHLFTNKKMGQNKFSELLSNCRTELHSGINGLTSKTDEDYYFLNNLFSEKVL